MKLIDVCSKCKWYKMMIINAEKGFYFDENAGCCYVSKFKSARTWQEDICHVCKSSCPYALEKEMVLNSAGGKNV